MKYGSPPNNMQSTSSTVESTSTPHVLDLPALKGRFCGPNVQYAPDKLVGLEWFTSEKKGDYVIRSECREIYDYAVLLDRVNTPLPPPVHFAVPCVLPPAANGLGADINPKRLIPGSRHFGLGFGDFVDYEDMELSPFTRAWAGLVSLAEVILPLSVDVAATEGLFHVVPDQRPALNLVHAFVQVGSFSAWLNMQLNRGGLRNGRANHRREQYHTSSIILRSILRGGQWVQSADGDVCGGCKIRTRLRLCQLSMKWGF